MFVCVCVYVYVQQLQRSGEPDTYRAMFRAVHALFAASMSAAAMARVAFMWTVNAKDAPAPAFAAAQPAAAYFPSADVVDLVGINGYNWGAGGAHAWRTPAATFAPMLATVRQFGVPVALAETSSAGAPGLTPAGEAKGAWLRDVLRFAGAERLAFVLFFNEAKERDWRVFDLHAPIDGATRTNADGDAFFSFPLMLAQVRAMTATTVRPADADAVLRLLADAVADKKDDDEVLRLFGFRKEAATDAPPAASCAAGVAVSAAMLGCSVLFC